MDYISVIKQPIESELEDFVQLFNESLSHTDGLLQQVLDHIRKRAGKRMRPMLILLMALATGADTHKLKYGHRGVNQPVTDLVTGRTYMTSQNHGYAVVSDSVNGIGAIRFRNANDGTCEGVDYPDRHAFSVQFHPEAHSGPLDTSFLFDRFIAMTEGK